MLIKRLVIPFNRYRYRSARAAVKRRTITSSNDAFRRNSLFALNRASKLAASCCHLRHDQRELGSIAAYFVRPFGVYHTFSSAIVGSIAAAAPTTVSAAAAPRTFDLIAAGSVLYARLELAMLCGDLMLRQAVRAATFVESMMAGLLVLCRCQRYSKYQPTHIERALLFWCAFSMIAVDDAISETLVRPMSKLLSTIVVRGEISGRVTKVDS